MCKLKFGVYNCSKKNGFTVLVSLNSSFTYMLIASFISSCPDEEFTESFDLVIFYLKRFPPTNLIHIQVRLVTELS